jgi:hypothetical protein
VQLDDAYLGGERSGGKPGRGSENKVPFVAAVSMNDVGRPLVVSCGTQHSESMVVVEPGGHVGRSLAGLSTCPRGGSSQRLS